MHQTRLEQDPRFIHGIERFNAQEFDEAGDAFEELFFEAIVGELEFVRLFLQLSTGCLHAERRQPRAAIERLQEGVLALDRVTDHRGYDLTALRADTIRLINQLRTGAAESGCLRISTVNPS